MGSHRLVMQKKVKVKVKWSRYRPGVAQRVGRGIALLFHDRGNRRSDCSAARPGRSLPPWKTRYPFYRRLGGPQGRSGRAENLVPTRIRSPDRPAHSQSLYRLSYPAQTHHAVIARNSRYDPHLRKIFKICIATRFFFFVVVTLDLTQWTKTIDWGVWGIRRWRRR